MKKIIFMLFFAIGFISCNSDDDNQQNEELNIERNATYPSDLPALYKQFYEESGGLNYATVNGSKMSFTDNRVQEKPVIILLHGLPDSNFLYRDVIKAIGNEYRVIAPDHIGYGLSDKPDLDYSFTTISNYIEGLINVLELKDVHLVITDVGGPAGFGYAARNPNNVKSLTFYETLWLPVDDLENSNYSPEFQQFLLAIRTPGVGEQIAIEENQFLGLLDQLTVTSMPQEVQDVYNYPWLIKEDRSILLENSRSIPVAGLPVDSKVFFDNFVEYLSITQTPKLVINATPGAISPTDYVNQAVQLFPNTITETITDAGHFVTEDKPQEFTNILLEFIQNND